MPPRLAILWTCFSLMAIGVGTVAADPPCPTDGQPRVAWWAIPSDTGHYLGYFVGGGCGRPLKGEPRRPDEGTWGWDYQGLIPRRVVLDWWHGRRDQGGAGAYDSVGPRLYNPGQAAK